MPLSPTLTSGLFPASGSAQRAANVRSRGPRGVGDPLRPVRRHRVHCDPARAHGRGDGRRSRAVYQTAAGLLRHARDRNDQPGSHDPITGTQALHTITDPVTTPSGTRVARLWLGQKRSHALLTALPMFRLQPDGFHNRDLRDFTAQLRGLTPTDVTPGRSPTTCADSATTASSNASRTATASPIPALATSMFLSAVHDRLLPTGLAELNTPTPTPLRSAAHAYQTAIDDLTRSAGLAA